jgi:hypothetical protein
MEIQFLAWDWHKNVSGSKLKNGITTLHLRKNMFLLHQMIMMSSLNWIVTHEVRF